MKARKFPPFARLLPSVIVVGFGLLVLNASGLIHDAYAQIGQPAPADAMAPQPAGNKDFASDDNQIASASEVDVLTSLSKRRNELDAREADIESKANILAATEARVDSKIAQLKTLQGQITTLLAQRDDAQEKQVAALVKTYSAMKPQAAARIFENMSDAVLLPVAQEMKSDVLAPVLAAMNPDQAQKLTVKLASRLSLPDTNGAQAQANPAPAAAPAAASATAEPSAEPKPGN